MGRRIAAVLLCTALALNACAGDAAPESTPADSIPDPGREMAITNNDGQRLEARAWGTGNRYVVLAHMRPADMTSWFDFARLLADEGFTAIAFNFRGYGESGGEPGEFAVAADVRAVVDAAVAEGAVDVFVIGASMGGTGAVVASASNDIAGTVTISAPHEFEGDDAVTFAQLVRSPMLLIAADEDGDAADDALLIASEVKGETELVVLAGSQHGTNMFAEHGEEITAKILEFLGA